MLFDDFERILVSTVSGRLYLRLIVAVPEVCPIAQGQLFVYMDVGILFILIVPDLIQHFGFCCRRKANNSLFAIGGVTVHDFTMPVSAL